MTGRRSRPTWLRPPSQAHFALAMAMLVTVMAVGVLLGWALGWPLLTSGLPGLVQTKVNAAASFLCLAASMGLMATAPRQLHPIAWAMSVLVVAIASATLLEHFSGVSLGIDQLFVTDPASATSPHPGRFAVQTGVALCAAALACLSMGRSIRGVHPAEVLALVCGIVGGVSLLGYLYGAKELLSLGSATQISLPASVGLIALAAGLIAADPEHALVRQIADPGPAGQVIRRIMPAALVIVPAGAWVRLQGERAGLYDESIGLSIMVSLEALLLLAVGVWTTASVRRLVAQRQKVELDLVRLGAAVATPLIETAPVGLAVLDRDLRYLYVNPALASMDGMEALAHLGQRLDRVSPELGTETTNVLEGVLKSGEAVRDIEVSGRASSSTEPGAWLLSAEPLRDETDEPIGLAISVIEITDRKHRAGAAEALADLRRQSQVIGDSIPFGFWIAEPDGRMRYLSPQFLELVGRSEEQALGSGWIEALAPEEAQATLLDWHAAMAARLSWNRELTIEGADGLRHTILSRGFPVRSEDGKVTSWAGTNLDITDRKGA
jgi:PAS domain S-box-containing protein